MSARNEFRSAATLPTMLVVLMTTVSAGGCQQKMDDQPHVKPLAESDFFEDGLSARPLVPGTVARGHLKVDRHYFTGKVNGKPATTLPARITRDWKMPRLLARGQERFDIFCSACHDRVGNGRGMVVQRGFPQPPSYHTERLRNEPIGHFFEVATNGFGRMPSYADQIPVADRWAIAAYVRALQLSQHAPETLLNQQDTAQLQ